MTMIITQIYIHKPICTRWSKKVDTRETVWVSVFWTTLYDMMCNGNTQLKHQTRRCRIYNANTVTITRKINITRSKILTN